MLKAEQENLINETIAWLERLAKRVANLSAEIYNKEDYLKKEMMNNKDKEK